MAMHFSKTKRGSWRDKRDKRDHSQGKGGSVCTSLKMDVHFETHDGAKSPWKEDHSGHHWCNPMNKNHSYCCGKRDHIAAHCIHDMPPDIVK
jgi:hypothetical protein